ncbi:hypothetical protein ACFVXQ_11120 [Kitasatospora sp. NPDC058263]
MAAGGAMAGVKVEVADGALTAATTAEAAAVSAQETTARRPAVAAPGISGKNSVAAVETAAPRSTQE